MQYIMILLKKTVYEKLVTMFNDVITSGLVLKTPYSTDKSGLEKKTNDSDQKIPDTSCLVKKSRLEHKCY